MFEKTKFPQTKFPQRRKHKVRNSLGISLAEVVVIVLISALIAGAVFAAAQSTSSSAKATTTMDNVSAMQLAQSSAQGQGVLASDWNNLTATGTVPGIIGPGASTNLRNIPRATIGLADLCTATRGNPSLYQRAEGQGLCTGGSTNPSVVTTAPAPIFAAGDALTPTAVPILMYQS
ncbi:hypothetical protein [Anthocerotibacter panamensis]|uniref:hypothetical protein n=1 Tax=Anthocerotibacter panamensis TaxID=2857077 RepID=UPI001C40162A|nr:hypothetical protein [Anthocerotibacter panamensis]